MTQNLMRILKVQLALPFAALMALVIPAFGQVTSGNVTGTVYDPTGATVPNATVVAHNSNTGADTTTTSTAAGDYRFENLPVVEEEAGKIGRASCRERV